MRDVDQEQIDDLYQRTKDLLDLIGQVTDILEEYKSRIIELEKKIENLGREANASNWEVVEGPDGKPFIQEK